MTPKSKFVTTAVLMTIVGFLLSPQAPVGGMLWPPAEVDHYGTPTGVQIGLLMLYTLLSDIAFGVGVAFLAFGRSKLALPGVTPRLATAMHLAVSFLLISWVPHDALHQSITTMAALIALEYGFHLNLIIVGLIAMRFFSAVVQGRAAPAGGAAAAGARAPA